MFIILYDITLAMTAAIGRGTQIQSLLKSWKGDQVWINSKTMRMRLWEGLEGFRETSQSFQRKLRGGIFNWIN